MGYNGTPKRLGPWPRGSDSIIVMGALAEIRIASAATRPEYDTSLGLLSVSLEGNDANGQIGALFGFMRTHRGLQ
jgi:hypothetical protein